MQVITARGFAYPCFKMELRIWKWIKKLVVNLESATDKMSKRNHEADFVKYTIYISLII